MRKLLLSFSLLTTFSVFAQLPKYPKGIYFKFKDLKTGKPSNDISVEIDKTSLGGRLLWNKNDYKLISKDPDVVKSVLRRDVFAYSDGDSLYINCKPHHLHSGYTPITSQSGPYLFFSVIQGSPSAIIPAAGIATIGEANGVRFLYYLDSNTGEVDRLNQDMMNYLLADHVELYDLYKKEKFYDREDVLLNYIKLLENSKVN